MQERAIKLEGELNFALKFKKTLNGKKVTEEVGNSLMADAVIVIAEMYAEAKTIKSLTASGNKRVLSRWILSFKDFMASIAYSRGV